MKKIIAQATLVTLLLVVAAPALANGGGGGAPCPCTPYSTTIISDTTDIVVADGSNAVAVVPHLAWTAVIPGSTTWVWKSGPTALDEVVAFKKSFTVTGATVLSATLDIATDNSYAVFIDGAPVASDALAVNFTLATQDSHNLTASVTTGAHTLRIEVKNVGAYNAASNPAGLLYKLVVESETCPSPDCCGGDVDVTVKNKDTTVINIVGASANTGWNAADGGSATTRVRGGNVNGSGNDNNATNGGGNSSTGGNGGTVITGNATARTGVLNAVNTTVVRVRRL